MKKTNIKRLCFFLFSTTSVFAAAAEKPKQTPEEKSPQAALVDAVLANAPKETLRFHLNKPGVNINAPCRDYDRATILHQAVEVPSNDEEVAVSFSTVQSLLDLNADITARNKYGNTALMATLTHSFCERRPERQKKIAQLLIDQHPTKEQRQRYLTIEDFNETNILAKVAATMLGFSVPHPQVSIEFIQLLLDANCDIHHRSSKTRLSALDFSIVNHEDVSRYLLAHKADPDQRPNEGPTFREQTQSFPKHKAVLDEIDKIRAWEQRQASDADESQKTIAG